MTTDVDATRRRAHTIIASERVAKSIRRLGKIKDEELGAEHQSYLDAARKALVEFLNVSESLGLKDQYED